MLRNDNGKVIGRLAKRALLGKKGRSMSMILAVALSSFLLFSVFTVGSTYYKMQQIQNLRMNGEEADVILYGLTEEQKSKCEQNPDITAVGICAVCGWVEETSEDLTPNVGLMWADETYWNEMKKPAIEKVEGTYPKARDEIMVTKEALADCGFERLGLGVGDSLEMTYGTPTGLVTGTFRISGVWEGYGAKKVFYMSEAFYEDSGYELSSVSSGRCYLNIKQKIMTQKEQEALIDSLNLEKQQDLFFLGGLGDSVKLLMGLGGLIFLTCLCAYLLIYNIMYLSVASNVRYYGLLQTVGMTVRQIKSLMKRQMLLVMTTGITVGIVLGGLVSFFLIPAIIPSLGIHKKYVEGVGITFRPEIFFLTVLFSALTVAIAYWKPTKIAASVTPVEALGYRRENVKRKRRKTGHGSLLVRMAKEQFVKDKKKTTVVMLSLAASLSVFLCLVTMLESQGARTLVSNYMDMDLVMKNDTLKKEDSEKWKQLFTESCLKDIEETEGVKEVHPFSDAQIIVPWEPEFADPWMREFYSMWMSIPYEDDIQEYKDHPENFGSVIVGIDGTEFDYLNSTLKTSLKKEDFLAGKTCVLYSNDLEFTDEDLAGKQVTCAEYGDSANERTFQIGALTNERYYIGPLLGYPPTIIVSEHTLREFIAEPMIYKVSILYENEYDEAAEQEIFDKLKRSTGLEDISWESKIEEVKEVEKAQGNMMEIGLGIVLILAFIGIMNYINTSVGNIQSRQVEISVMESIGMTGRQVKQMLIAEGILLAAGAFLLTGTVGLGVTYFLYESMNYRGVPFEVPALPMLAACVVLVAVCVSVPLIAYRRLEKNGSLVERIRGFE